MASSAVFQGQNIPNYDDIREKYGFKNLNYGNSYGEPNKESFEMIEPSQQELQMKYYKDSTFIIVALHELLGHGSGKLFYEKPSFPNPLTKDEISTFYQEK